MKITDITGTVTLNNGYKMPYLGLGVFKVKEGDEVFDSVSFALEHGYRHVDTAALYGNERGVGKAIHQSGIPREEIFVTSKVWNTDQGYDQTLRAFDQSMQRLDFQYLDLYLVHWPVKGKYKETWKALEKLYRDGRVKAIGISNFMQHHIEDLLTSAEIIPTVNQMEFSPKLIQQSLIDYCAENQIRYEAWSPFMQGQVFEIPLLKEIASQYNKTIGQLVVRWNLQKGVVTIPKSSNRERILENADVFDFEISEEDMIRIDSLDTGYRVGADPDNFNF